ncbi:armadillo-like helical domain-containing protein [Tieghemostelium lacteum]|uniref:Armadillo-like helical domain-containing protein n=1 Tax=Tieghemostelium lacteum TaxID=361077 RepID=A0A151ZSH1_TIELA|nr:armadillo-like helical domain-containing protein [Tieghemostelium lacteum]|eukprot:KYQ96880.1 armadillo-like helical domain-containing protein [Tieghemostelium lacteum]
MNFNDEINSIVKALESLHSSTSSNEIRQSAQVYLEEIKNRDNCSLFAIHILKSGIQYNDYVKHFALHLIENIIKFKWYSSVESDKELLKSEILNLMSGFQPNEQKFIREKMVTIIVEIIKRDWPQKWINLLESLIVISKTSDTQTEMVLAIFRQLPHDIIFESTSTTTNNLTDQRRKDLMAGINHAVQSLFDYFFALLEKHYRIYKSNVTLVTNNHLLSSLLETVKAYIDWIPVKIIYSHKLDFIFIQLLHDPPFRLLAADNLLLWVDRKSRPDEKLELLQTPFQNIEPMWQSITVKVNDEDDYTFHKKIALLLNLIGTHHLNSNENFKPFPANYPAYLKMMIDLLQHPGILLSSHTIGFWQLFLKNNSVFDSNPQMFQLMPSDFTRDQVYQVLLDILLNKLVRVGDPEKETSCPQSKFSAYDFSTTKEWSNFYAQIRANILSLIKSLTHINQEKSYMFVAKRIGEVMESIKPNPNITLSHDQTMVIESHHFALETVVSTCDKELYDNDQVKKLTEQVLKCLIDLVSSDPNITSFQIDCLSCFTLYYGKHPEIIQFILAKVLPLIKYTNAQTDNVDTSMGFVSGISSNSLHTRRRAIASLIKLSSEIPNQLTPFMEFIYTSILQLFQQNLLTDNEKVMGYHLFISFCNHQPNYAQTLDFYKEILAPILKEWNSSDYNQAVQSPEQLILYLGFDQPSPTTQPQQQTISHNDPYVRRRRTFNFIISTLGTFWKKSVIPSNINTNSGSESDGYLPFISNGISYQGKYPISHFVKDIFPNLLALNRTLHALWDPVMKQKVHPTYHTIFHLNEAVLVPMMGHEYHKDNKTESENLTFSRNLLDGIRESCYEIIGNGFTHADELYSISNLSNYLIESVFSHLEFIENRHLKIMAKMVLPNLIKCTPVKLMAEVFQPVLPMVLTLFFNRIKSGWDSIIARKQQQQPQLLPQQAPVHHHEGEEKHEIVDDRILKDMTSEYLQWISTFLQTPQLFKNNDIMVPFIYALAYCLQTGDGGLVKRVFKMTTTILDTFVDASDSTLHKLIGEDMFATAIKAISNNPDIEQNNNLITLIKEIYIKLHGMPNQYPQGVLLTLPNVNHSVVEKLSRDLQDKKSDKIQRSLFKSLLNDIVGVCI